MKRIFALATLLALIAIALPADAQRNFNFNQTQNSSSSSSSQRTYYSNGMIGEAIIEADRDSRSIIVITDDYTNEHIKAIIENLDRPVQQVLIKVLFVEVTYRDDYDFGIEGSIDINNDRSGSNVFDTAFGVAAESAGGFYRLLESDLSVTMRAIAEVGKTEVLSRPSILTRNNQEAVITVGQEVPFITSSQTTDQGNTINVIEYEDIGIILRVTPFITKDGLVEMILAPEISTITDETVPISETVNSPVFAKRSADTVVVTPNGQTVVIGGMMEDNNIEVESKIPILGDIPLLGSIFRRTQNNKSKTELLIFLTPYVMEGPEKLIERTTIERNESELLPKAFTPKQFEQYLGQPQAPSTVESAPGEAPTETSSEQSETRTRSSNSKGRPF
ncbi:MAG: hypothetical protein P9L94_04760 [Candidatus Hinthialibacter antarcticus]|nr:hypothetical protein [Candidatus Hinthialibacter antarcticus]